MKVLSATLLLCVFLPFNLATWHYPYHHYNKPQVYHQPQVRVVYLQQPMCARQPCARPNCARQSCNNRCPVQPPPPRCSPPPSQPYCPPRYPCPAQPPCYICPPWVPCPVPTKCPVPPPVPTAPQCSTPAPQDCKNETNAVFINIETLLQTCIKSKIIERIFTATRLQYETYHSVSSVGLYHFDLQKLVQTYLALYQQCDPVLRQNYHLNLQLGGVTSIEKKCTKDKLMIESVSLQQKKSELDKQVTQTHQRWTNVLKEREKCKISLGEGSTSTLGSSNCKLLHEYQELYSILMNKKAGREIVQNEQEVIKQEITKIVKNPDVENHIDLSTTKLLTTFCGTKHTNVEVFDTSFKVPIVDNKDTTLNIDLELEKLKQDLARFCIRFTSEGQVDNYNWNTKVKAWSKTQLVDEIPLAWLKYKNALIVNRDLHLKLRAKNVTNACGDFDIHKLYAGVTKLKSQVFTSKLQLLYLNGQIKKIKEEIKHCPQGIKQVNIVQQTLTNKPVKAPKNLISSNLVLKSVDNKKYYFAPTMLPWQKARQVCRENKMNLVQLENDAKFKRLITALANNQTAGELDKRYWIGATEKTTGQDDFVWASNLDPVTFAAWTKAPKTSSVEQLCAIIGRWKSPKVMWRKVPCNLKKLFICE